MSQTITYEVNKRDLMRVENRLKGMERKAPKVFKAAINATAKDAVNLMAASADKSYTVKSGGWKRNMKTQKASTGKLCATITSKGKTLSIIDFKFRGNRATPGGSAASTDIVKTGMKKLQKSGIKAFRGRGGNAGFSKNIWQRKGKSRLPIRRLSANSVPKMLEMTYKGNHGISGGLKKPIQQALHKHINEEIKKLI